MESRESTKRRALPRILIAPLIVAGILLLLPLLLATYLLYAIVLQLVVWLCWCTRGINVLVVYSDSPYWQEYIETQLIPKLPPTTVVLNWSERRKWKSLSLPVLAFRLFGGSSEFNPLVVVFRPFRWTRTFRFWKPFRDYKHGKTTNLEELESKLFQHLTHTGIAPAR